MSKETAKWWSGKKVSDYQKECKIPVNYIHYGPCCPTESKLKLLGNIKNKNILEIGCGGAQNSIYFVKHGAKVKAIDISKDQIEFAKNLAKKHKVKIDFYVKDIKTLTPIKSSSQDIVFSAFALQYVDNHKKCFKEVNRVLKKKGLFVFSIDHPFFRTISPKTLKIQQSYFKTGKYTEDYGDYGKFVAFDYTISDLFNDLIESGFEVVKILEPKQDKKNPDPWRNLWDYTPDIVKNLPPSIIFKAIKK